MRITNCDGASLTSLDDDEQHRVVRKARSTKIALSLMKSMSLGCLHTWSIEHGYSVFPSLLVRAVAAGDAPEIRQRVKTN